MGQLIRKLVKVNYSGITTFVAVAVYHTKGGEHTFAATCDKVCYAQKRHLQSATHLHTALLKLTFQSRTHKVFVKIAGEPTVNYKIDLFSALWRHFSTLRF